MMRTTKLTLALTLGVSLIASPATAGSPEGLTEDERARHVLSRLGFGPRPGDVENVLSTGVERYIAQQLRPERIDDRQVERKLSRFDVLRMSERELHETFQRPVLEMAQQRDRRPARTKEERDAQRRAQEMRRRVPPESHPRRIVEELSAAKVIRAVESNRQLEEVMADFWFNHFNVSADKGLCRILIANYERDVIRPNMWGRFEDLLMATAKSPAMLVYLDNVRSVAVEENRPWPEWDDAEPARPGTRGAGLNETYARTLLGVHTLGVGGATQKDVTELARVLTGWSIDGQGADRPVTFVFRRQLHDVKPKTVLGVTLGAGGGIDEGERMIRVLANHPSTARHIATKLSKRFIAYDPPPALVDRVAKRFLETRGDLRATVEAVVTSPELFDPAHFRAKTKTPFAYVASAIRAVGGTTDGLTSAKVIAEIGQPLYRAQPPTGYSDDAKDRDGSGALSARLRYASELASDRAIGTRLGIAADDLPDSELLDALAQALVGGALSDTTRAAIEQRLAAGDDFDRAALAAGLILGSPEFQRQ